MKLVAEVLTGTLFHVEIGEDATVQDLKNKIGTQENLPTERLILMLDADGSHCLLGDNENPVKEYGIRDGSRIYIFFRPTNNKPSFDPPASPSARSTSSQESVSKGKEAISAAPLSPESTTSKMN